MVEMEDNISSAEIRKKQDMRKRKRRQQQRRRKKLYNYAVILLGLIILVVAAVFLWMGVIHRLGPEPAQVKELKVSACYAEIDLAWDQARKAKGYYIYASEDGEDFARIGEVVGKDNCHFVIEDYTHDKEYWFRVAGYGYNALSKNKNEGEPSEKAAVEYDSDRYAQKIPILTYHGFTPEGVEGTDSLSLPQDRFDEQMKYLSDNGYRTLTLDEFRQWHQGKLEVPKKSCVITIDDGQYEAYYLALPVFEKYGQAATCFCIGSKIPKKTDPFVYGDGKTHYIGEDVMKKLRKEKSLFTLESHTYDMHERVNGKMPAKVFTYEQIMDDCKANEKFDFHYLAYPWGANTETMRRAVRDSGYKMAFAYRPFLYARRTDDPYAVNRIKVYRTMDMNTFIDVVKGEDERYDEGVE